MDHTRHSDIYSASLLSQQTFAVVGCGGIGATTAITLAKMGAKFFHLFDFDKVGEENIATQFFKVSDVGMPKVIALAQAMREYSDEVNIRTYNDEIIEPQSGYLYKKNIVICAVDTIKARQNVYEAFDFDWFLETRMGAQEFQLNIAKRTDYEWYEQYLFSQSDADIEDLPCTSKATIFCSMLAASIVGGVVKKIVNHEPLPHKIVADLREFSMFTV